MIIKSYCNTFYLIWLFKTIFFAGDDLDVLNDGDEWDGDLLVTKLQLDYD